MKVLIFCLALFSLTDAVYVSRSPINRMTTLNRLRPPTAFRPGVSMQGMQSYEGLQSFQSMQRPWSFGSMRLAPAPSQRAPYYLYRSQPQRYAMKHYSPATRNVFTHSPWKTARLPLMAPAPSEYDFLKAATAHAVAYNDGGTGAIHTIPAPNLSLSEKPIVVLDTSESPAEDQAKPTYEVTEKFPEEYNVAKIEPPTGFTKPTSFSTPELQTLIKNGATLQLAPEYSMPAVSRLHPLMPHQFQMQGLSSLPTHQDFLNTGAEGIFIAPNALFQSDPMYLQKIQTQLLQRFPAVEFIPYDADVPNQFNFQPQQQQASEHNPHIVLLQNEQIDRPITLRVPEQSGNKNVVARGTQEASVATITPKAFVAPNTTEKHVEEISSQQPQNLTIELVAVEPLSASSTVKYIVETNTEEGNTTPIYYAQVGQSVGNVVANGFYSAINDVRAAATVAQMDKASEALPEKPIENTATTTTLVPDLKAYFVPNEDKPGNETKTELKPVRGAPFKKASESVNIAYTLVRAGDKQPKQTQEGAVYAGQIVEASISEDQDFNKEKATLVSRRAPIRLLAVKDSNNIASAIKSTTPEVEVVKAKIPAKTKLTFDHKTGEPILRIYASYSDSPAQKDVVLTKLATLKPAKDSVIKRDLTESWKGTTVKTADKSQGFDANQVTGFGLKIKHRSDDYIPLFQEYED